MDRNNIFSEFAKEHGWEVDEGVNPTEDAPDYNPAVSDPKLG